MKNNRIRASILLLIFVILVTLTITSCSASPPTIIDSDDIYSSITALSDEQLKKEINTRMAQEYWENNMIPDYIQNCTIILFCQNELNKREIMRNGGMASHNYTFGLTLIAPSDNTSIPTASGGIIPPLIFVDK